MNNIPILRGKKNTEFGSGSGPGPGPGPNQNSLHPVPVLGPIWFQLRTDTFASLPWALGSISHALIIYNLQEEMLFDVPPHTHPNSIEVVQRGKPFKHTDH